MQIRNQILEVLEKHLRIASAAGDNISCYCPFHKGGKESRPSFYVYLGPPEGSKVPGMSFCHTCNKGWSLKGLLRSFGVARVVIDQVTKDLPQGAPRQTPTSYARGLQFSNPALPEEMLVLFEYCPKLLLKEGFEMDVLFSFDIGFDMDRRRVTFPLRDHLGNLIGISGRAVDSSSFPRYYIYGSEEFREVASNYKLHKGRFLWNLDQYYAAAMLGKRIPYLIVVEGFKQAMWLYQHGYQYVVALMGSHMSKEQATLLLRIGAPIYLFLDNDDAGQKAMKRLPGWLRKQSPEVYTIVYPAGTEGLSPDDFDAERLHIILRGLHEHSGQDCKIQSTYPEGQQSCEANPGSGRGQSNSPRMDQPHEVGAPDPDSV